MRTLTRPTRRTRPLALPAGFIWLKHLDSAEQTQFVSGLFTRLVSAVQANEWSSVTEWIEDWQATANIYADSQVARAIERGQKELQSGDSMDWAILQKELGL